MGGGVSVMGEDNCCYPRWIHTTNYRTTDFTLGPKRREPRPKVSRTYKDGKQKGLPIHKCTGWRFLVTAG